MAPAKCNHLIVFIVFIFISLISNFLCSKNQMSLISIFSLLDKITRINVKPSAQDLLFYTWILYKLRNSAFLLYSSVFYCINTGGRVFYEWWWQRACTRISQANDT